MIMKKTKEKKRKRTTDEILDVVTGKIPVNEDIAEM